MSIICYLAVGDFTGYLMTTLAKTAAPHVFFQISDQTENEAMVAIWPAEHSFSKE